MIKYYAIPKVWFSVLLYFAIIELVIIFTKPSLFLDWNFILTRIIFVFAFTFSVIIKRKISKNFFQLLQNILVFALMTFLYKETAMLNTLIFPKIDEFLSNLDQNIFNSQPSIEFSKHFNSLFFSELFYFGYFCYYLLPLVVLEFCINFCHKKSKNSDLF